MLLRCGGARHLIANLRGPLLLQSRGVSKNVLEHGGFSRKGDFPGFPQNTSATLTLPGETEKETTIGNFAWLGEEQESFEKEVPFGTWTPESQRVGAIARKVGMMNVWDARGVKTLCTVLKIEDCQVVEVRKFLSGRGHPRVNLQLGAGHANPKRMLKCQLGSFRKAGVEPKKKLADFPVTLDAVLPVGTQIEARHFIAGQYVDLTGMSRGHGFQGGMKRWGFAGQRATHGVSLTHRAIGSTGACQDPGKTWKGKKMPGNMGKNKCTFLNMLIYKIDVKRNLIFIKVRPIKVPRLHHINFYLPDCRNQYQIDNLNLVYNNRDLSPAVMTLLSR